MQMPGQFFGRTQCGHHDTDQARPWLWPIFVLAICLAALTRPGLGWAQTSGPEICLAAAQNASDKTGVPYRVLQAISLTETGRKSGRAFQPWPWTVNMEGKGDWFDTPAQALAYVNKHHTRGARSFDVGCFQLNYKWHGHAFSSIQHMFDPTANALYAANFLRDLYNEFGSWPDAAGAYHSRTPSYANRYKKRFQRLYAQLDGGPPSVGRNIAQAAGPTAAPEQAIVARLNRFPLLQGGSTPTASLGSLMPASAGISSQRLLGGG